MPRRSSAEQAAALVEQAHHHRLAVLRRHGRDAHVDLGVAHLDVEAAVLRQALLRDVQPGHELQAQHQRRGDLGVGLGLHVQHAVDAEADDAACFPAARCGCRRRAPAPRPRTPSAAAGRPARPRPRCASPSAAKSMPPSPSSWPSSWARPVISLGAPVDPVDGLQQQRFR